MPLPCAEVVLTGNANERILSTPMFTLERECQNTSEYEVPATCTIGVESVPRNFGKAKDDDCVDRGGLEEALRGHVCKTGTT
jgi:hypothetical protein